MSSEMNRSGLTRSALHRSGGWPTSSALAPTTRGATMAITGAGPRGVRLEGVSERPLTASQALGITDTEYFLVRERAMRDSAAGRWAHALDAYRLAVILGPTDPFNWEGLAEAYEALGDSIGAEKATECAAIMHAHAAQDRTR